MRLTPITIKNTAVKNNVFLAPLAGYTNYPFRRLCKDYGAGLCYTEMVSAKGLKYGSENTEELLYTDAEEGVCAVQIFGSDPDIMRAACEHAKIAPFPIVDINMGCPVPKIYKNGEGSALLENPALAEKIVKECVKSGKTITVKFRIGITDKQLITEEFAKRMEGEDERQNHRISDLEEHFKIVTNLVVSTEKLALSMESMAKELARQGAKLNDLEMKPAKRWDLLITTIITGIAGAMIGIVVGGWLP
jgi:hypothetical protein